MRYDTSPPALLFSLAASATLAALALLCPTVSAQDVVTQDGATHLQLQASPPGSRLIDVQFSGGTVADYIAALRKADAAANVVLIPPASEVQLPTIELKCASINAAVYLLNDLLVPHPSGLAKLQVGSVDRRQADESQIYTVGAMLNKPGRNDPAANTLNAPLETRVWSIADLLDNHELQAEQILSAIEGGLDLLKDEYKPAQIRFHADTGLIIASGHSAQVGIIHEIIHNLWEARQQQVERSRPLSEWQQAVNERDGLIHQLRTENEKLQAERDAAQRDFRSCEIESHQLKLEIAHLTDRLRHTERELNELQSQRDGQP